MEIREFYSKDSGERYYEHLTGAAQVEADNVASFFYSLAFEHEARKALPELTQLQAELKSLVDGYRARLQEIDGKLPKARGQELTQLKAEQWQLSTNFTRDDGALSRVEYALKAVRSVRAPVSPAWLDEYIRSLR